MTCALYAKDNDLETPCWKRFKKMAKRQKMLVRMATKPNSNPSGLLPSTCMESKYPGTMLKL
jgi:hypothetical protein